MALTYNQVIKRIQTIALGHKQVRTFKRGLVTDFLTDKTIPYAAVFLQDSGAAINPDQNNALFNFRLFFLDLVHVSEDAKDNELDVLSDMFSVAMDIVAQLKFPAFNDWRISGANNMQSIVENDGDMNAGWYLDLSVTIMYDQNVCEVPTTITDYLPENPDDMKLVYDVKYIADGTEGTTLNIPEIVGKKLLLLTREYSPLYKVSNLPQSTEYTWDDVSIELGLETQAGERFLALYRTY